VALSAWFEIASRFHDVITARAVEAFAHEPARLTAVLLINSELIEKSLKVIAGDYHAAKQEREREIRARHARMIDAALDAVIEIDEQEIVREFNPAAERTFGYRKAEAIGAPLSTLIIPPRLRERHRAGVARLLATGQSQMIGRRVELVAMRADGSELVVEMALVATDGLDGGRSFIGFLRDTSERDELAQTRAQAKHAIARSAAHLEILSNAAHEFASQSGDVEPLLAMVARRLGEILGEGCAVRLISADGAWLEPSTSYYHRDPAVRERGTAVFDRHRQRLGDGVAGKVAQTGVAVLLPTVSPDQLVALSATTHRALISRMPIASILTLPLRARGGETIGVINLLRSTPGNPYTIDDQHLAQDLADRAGLAIDNAVLIATLEQRVAARTSALEAVNRELEAFSYSVSHDLRTPLRAIDGFSRVLLKDYEAALDGTAQHYLQRIRSGTQRMSSLIDDLLNLARISRVPLDLGILDLSALASEVVSEIQKREPGRMAPVHIAPGLSVCGDGHLLRIVLENLLGNALKFTARHPSAEIWFGAQAQTFFVRDTGAGFDMAYAQKLFSPFQRLHPARDYEGTGIGLATVHRIIAHHGGRIWAEAEPDKGATFFFTLGG
jgi:PAS domain S-box-containing protein